jgi:hypothetical protein
MLSSGVQYSSSFSSSWVVGSPQTLHATKTTQYGLLPIRDHVDAGGDNDIDSAENAVNPPPSPTGARATARQHYSTFYSPSWTISSNPRPTSNYPASTRGVNNTYLTANSSAAAAAHVHRSIYPYTPPKTTRNYPSAQAEVSSRHPTRYSTRIYSTATSHTFTRPSEPPPISTTSHIGADNLSPYPPKPPMTTTMPHPPWMYPAHTRTRSTSTISLQSGMADVSACWPAVSETYSHLDYVGGAKEMAL